MTKFDFNNTTHYDVLVKVYKVWNNGIIRGHWQGTMEERVADCCNMTKNMFFFASKEKLDVLAAINYNVIKEYKERLAALPAQKFGDYPDYKRYE